MAVGIWNVHKEPLCRTGWGGSQQAVRERDAREKLCITLVCWKLCSIVCTCEEHRLINRVHMWRTLIDCLCAQMKNIHWLIVCTCEEQFPRKRLENVWAVQSSSSYTTPYNTAVQSSSSYTTPHNTAVQSSSSYTTPHNQCCAHAASFKNGTVNNNRK